MKPIMTEKEIELFTAFLRHSRGYIEFGCGGSTLLAVEYVKSWIISIDSSKEWIDKISAECLNKIMDLNFLHVDIGPIGNWGYPTTTSYDWSKYHKEIWRNYNKVDSPDLCLIDGRFRVACFIQTILHCPNIIIGIHDFRSREKYHVLLDIGREIASVDDLSFFVARPEMNHFAKQILTQYEFTPD